MLGVRRFRVGTVRLVKAGKEMQLHKLDTAELKLKLEEAKREVAEAKLGAAEKLAQLRMGGECTNLLGAAPRPTAAPRCSQI